MDEASPQSRIDTIVTGGSAGGVEVVHFPEVSTSMLPHILGRKGILPAAHAEDGV